MLLSELLLELWKTGCVEINDVCVKKYDPMAERTHDYAEMHYYLPTQTSDAYLSIYVPGYDKMITMRNLSYEAVLEIFKNTTFETP